MKKIFTLFLIVTSLAAQSQSLVISQVYGAGGNSGSVYKNDFVELFNPTGAAISIKNWSVQYNGATSTTTTWQKTKLPDVSILPGQYFLIAQAQGTGGTTDLPTPDVIGVTLMSGTAGKVVLVSDTNAITATCPTVNVIDKVGYGATANCFEGSGPTPAFGSNANSVIRNSSGCTDTDNNSADFTAAVVTPRNSASPVHSCGAVPALLTATPSTLPDFGLITQGDASVSASFDVAGTDLTGAPGILTFTASSADFEVSSDDATWGPSTTISYSGSSLTATPVYVRFTPQGVGDKTGTINITGGGATAVSVAVSGAGLAAVSPVLTVSAFAGFGGICINTTSVAKSFSLGGSNLTTDSISVGPLTGYSFATTAAGTYSASIKLAQPGGTFNQDIFVKFTPVLLQSYDGNIPITGGGITGTVNAAATGSGINTAPLETTEAANGITASKATLAGLIADKGCTAITAYGFEYSTSSGFANGTGTVVSSSNETTGNFSADVTGLIPSTTYYYKAFATNGAGKTYGEQRSFTTLVCAGPANSTGKAASVTTNSAVLPGSITDIGCSAVTAYGVQYSGVKAFTGGLTTSVSGSNIAGNSFSVAATGLVQNTKYYYRSFATNTGGTSFGGVDSFTTSRIAPGLVVYSNPVQRGGGLHFSIDNLRNEYHAAQLINSSGQIVYQKNMTVQIGFIDESFIVPAKLPAGVYVLKVLSIAGFEAYKRILIL